MRVFLARIVRTDFADNVVYSNLYAEGCSVVDKTPDGMHALCVWSAYEEDPRTGGRINYDADSIALRGATIGQPLGLLNATPGEETENLFGAMIAICGKMVETTPAMEPVTP
jgi:hypothetical protein